MMAVEEAVDVRSAVRCASLSSNVRPVLPAHRPPFILPMARSGQEPGRLSDPGVPVVTGPLI